MHQPVAQDLDKIHIVDARNFVDQLPGRCLSAKSLLGFD